MSESMSQEEFKRAAKGQRKAQLEQKFLESWRRLFPHLPRPEMQHRFCHRQWRFDFAWPDQKLAVEIDGGSFIRGAHNLPVQQTKDHEKANTAIKLGWRVLRFNTLAMKLPDEVATFVAEVLTNAKEVAHPRQATA